MKKTLLSFIVITFFIWLLPLGIFIKPSQEKTACDGQRAICMCHHADAQVKSNPIEGSGFKSSNPGSNKESASGSGAGNYFLVSNVSAHNALNINFFSREEFFAYSNPSLISVEHVPKV